MNYNLIQTFSVRQVHDTGLGRGTTGGSNIAKGCFFFLFGRWQRGVFAYKEKLGKWMPSRILRALGSPPNPQFAKVSVRFLSLNSSDFSVCLNQFII